MIEGSLDIFTEFYGVVNPIVLNWRDKYEMTLQKYALVHVIE